MKDQYNTAGKQDWLQMEERYRHLYHLRIRSEQKKGVVIRFPVEKVRR